MSLPFAEHDTIVAPVTPPGEGGVAIIRLSGGQSESLLGHIFRPAGKRKALSSHQLYYGHIVNTTGEPVDEVMAVLMKGPRSYTRQDVAEIHCHGGNLVVRQILDLLVGAGARLAQPGEFTLRAFLNGRIDLTRAEAVIDVIRARSEAACHQALAQMDGSLYRRLTHFREGLVHLLAEVEAGIDFPEEDLLLADGPRLAAQAMDIVGDMEALLASFDAGRILREGLNILIFGRPNVGKSSLMNALLGEARTIVTDIPGTTRDTIEENLVLGGLPLRLVDTAGVRATSDPVETEGVRRARAKLAGADLVLLVVDGSAPLTDDDRMALDFCSDREILLVINKCDRPAIPLPEDFAGLPAVHISVHDNLGLDALQEQILQRFGACGDQGRETAMLSDRRHRQALLRAHGKVQDFIAAIRMAVSADCAALELRQALVALGEITGETTPEDVLELIFSRFCIGK
ncbi:tRNA uridine-5-carboxymethylaminomethyl(34) synthesis GTPase MnmE [Desulfuromonas sp. CSMB_57]|uniref:tRNA uridine-5-carboxymethylaminomethyl(34) synthesis GTPase MnmE n=1 Tax=Desulfuromonas sp. CSMB_57 TaxID=2807629 RepID=UPI001CD6D1BF|nr:tRNA uridine-5-carboxymethylaminomethyl(34) synthesis GTPase MnmE [Desulfuromonas sp. CSMB_57]